MQFFTTYFSLSLKRRLHNVSYLITSLFFLLLMTLIAWMIPLDDGPSASVGISYDTSQIAAVKTVSLLDENSSFHLVLYPPEQLDQMKGDILAGNLIKGYVLDSEFDQKISTGDIVGLVETYVGEGSVATLIIDEMIASAIVEVSAPYTAINYVNKKFDGGLSPSSDMTDYIEQVLADGPLISMDISGGDSTLPEDAQDNMELFPMLYAILITLFILSAVFGCLMESRTQTIGTKVMIARSNRPFSIYCAPLFAYLLTDIAVLIACDMMIGLFLPTNPYMFSTRLLVVVILALFTTCFVLFLRQFKKWHAVITVLIPIFVMQNLFFSGAILNPVSLGTPLSLLRFISPSWYLLQLLNFLG